MATNAASLVNFGTTGPAVGEFVYSIGPLTAPSYLPANLSTTSYLTASYPALSALINTPATTFSATYPTLSPTTGWINIAYGNSVFVAISQGPNTNAAYSSDGTTWSNSSLPNNDNWLSIAFGAGTFVTVGYGAAGSGGQNAATTSTGATWTARSLPSVQQWYAVAFGASTFVAISNAPLNAAGNVAATSPDGITWTSRTLPASAFWRNIAYGAGVFVALTTTTVAATSADGITWTLRSVPSRMAGSTITFGNGIFVAIGASGSSFTSSDGINWTEYPQVNGIYGGGQGYLTYGNGLFVAVYYPSYVYTSTDGKNWVTWTQNYNSPSNFAGIAFGGGVFCSVQTGYANTARMTIATTATAFQIPVIAPITGTTAYVKAT